MKKLIGLVVVICLLVGAIVPLSASADIGPTEYADVEGSYVCKGRIYSYKLDSTLLARERTAYLTITTQADSIISDASIQIGEEGTPIDLLGYVGIGPKPRISLYCIEGVTGEPPAIVGDLLIINGIVKIGRDDSVKYMVCWIQGLNNDATPFHILGSFRARPAAPD